jgi:hypothetical protein
MYGLLRWKSTVLDLFTKSISVKFVPFYNFIISLYFNKFFSLGILKITPLTFFIASMRSPHSAFFNLLYANNSVTSGEQ